MSIYISPTSAPLKIPFFLIFNAPIILPINILNAEIVIIATFIIFSDMFVYVSKSVTITSPIAVIPNAITLPNTTF